MFLAMWQIGVILVIAFGFGFGIGRTHGIGVAWEEMDRKEEQAKREADAEIAQIRMED